MKQHKPTQKAVVVFRQWQRKNYALFQVLGRQIRIAVLAAIYFLVTKPMDAQVLVQADSSIYDYELEEVEGTTAGDLSPGSSKITNPRFTGRDSAIVGWEPHRLPQSKPKSGCQTKRAGRHPKRHQYGRREF